MLISSRKDTLLPARRADLTRLLAPLPSPLPVTEERIIERCDYVRGIKRKGLGKIGVDIVGYKRAERKLGNEGIQFQRVLGS